jgi:hypothetical protein
VPRAALPTFDVVYRRSMPTNKLWLEHTERAAWDTIGALREKLLKAENRLQALVPGVARVEELFDLLDATKLKYAPQAAGHAAVVEELVAHIEQLRAERASNLLPPSMVTGAGPLPSFPFDWGDHPECEPDPLDDDSEALNRFTRALRHKAERSDPSGPNDMERLLQQAEDTLDEMSEADGVALRDAAVELALLAARIYAVSRSSD